MEIPEGWVCLTGLAKDHKKYVADWLRLNSTKLMLDKLSDGDHSSRLITIKGGPPERQGTWAHPDVGSKFLEWVQLSPVKSIRYESYHRTALASRFSGAQVEVGTPAGKCDIVTDIYAIEVKESRGWKSAIGQAQVYAFFLNKKPAIHLIGRIPEECRQACAFLGVAIV